MDLSGLLRVVSILMGKTVLVSKITADTLPFCSLVWSEIPPSAIVSTISVSSLISQSNTTPSMSKLLRLGVLMHTKASPTTLLEKLKDVDVKMTPKIAAAIGDLVILLGLSANSTFEQLSFLTAQICSGFAVKIEYKDNSQHRHLAACFGHSFSRRENIPLNLRDMEKVHLAFLVAMIIA